MARNEVVGMQMRLLLPRTKIIRELFTANRSLGFTLNPARSFFVFFAPFAEAS